MNELVKNALDPFFDKLFTRINNMEKNINNKFNIMDMKIQAIDTKINVIDMKIQNINDELLKTKKIIENKTIINRNGNNIFEKKYSTLEDYITHDYNR